LTRFEEAVTPLETALARDPDIPDAVSGLAFCRLVAGRYEDAVSLLETALATRSNAALWMHLGLVQLRMGEIEKAAASVNKAVEIAPGGGSNPMYLGLVDLSRGDLAAAVQAFRTSVAAGDSHPWVSMGLALAMEDQGDEAGAEAIHRTAIAAHPGILRGSARMLPLWMERRLMETYDRLAAP